MMQLFNASAFDILLYILVTIRYVMMFNLTATIQDTVSTKQLSACNCLPPAEGKEKNRLGPRREDEPPKDEKSSG